MKQVKTAKGKVLNMQAMYDANQTTQAVGNANMNARGDVLGPGGKVVIPKNKVTSAYYATNPNAVKEVSIKQDPEEVAREAMKEEAKEIERKTVQLDKSTKNKRLMNWLKKHRFRNLLN